jgi:hypothetical protein
VREFKILLTISYLIFGTVMASAGWADLLQYFANPNWGDDPLQPDTVYLVCTNLSPAQQVIQVRLKTDNLGRTDSIVGVYIPVIITTDKPGVTLDTTIATTFGGTDISSWQFLAVVVGTDNSEDPSKFPMKLVFGGDDPVQFPHLLANGDYLIASLSFSVSEPTNICIDTTSQVLTGLPLLLTTAYAVDYPPQWQEACCYIQGSIPTLSEWGLIIFSFLLLASLIFYLRRRTSTI